MRRLVLLCSALAFLTATVAADARPDGTRVSSDVSAAKKKREARKPPAPVDTRPRMRRGDDAVPVAATAAKPTAPAKKRSRATGKPGDVAQSPAGAEPVKASAKDVSACAQVRDHDAAIAGCTRIIEDQRQKPKGRAAAHYNRGNAHAAKGNPDAAIADYDEAIKLVPKNASAYNNRGTARNDKGEAEAALADFNEAIKHNASYASAYFNRANAYAGKGEAARAIADYDKALRFNRRNVHGYIARGALHLAAGAAAKARGDMKLAARLDRKNAYVVLWQDIAERRAKQKGILAGGKGLRDVEMKGWPAPVLLMFVGETKPADVLIAADDSNAALKQAHTCEANFYSGEYALIQGQRDEAVKLFRIAAKDCPRGFLEGIAASAELQGLGEKVEAN